MFQRIASVDWKNILLAAFALFALALIIAAILTFAPRRASQVPDLTASTEQDLPAFESEPGEPAALCRNALAQAKAAKRIPQTAALTDPDPRQTDWERRYVCDAAADEVNYALAFDQVCAKNNAIRCVNLITISKDDGEVIYQRPQ
ncbi:MAG TPA: hypothetical protein VL026_14585 [Rhizomicrobium sp.]|nr:hypothetical protein [Rhizomicrobium sp.]